MFRRIRRLLIAVVVLLALALCGFRLAAFMAETETADALAPQTGMFVETTQGRVFVQEAGPQDGLPILFVHGSGAWSGFWRDVMGAQAVQGNRAIAMDLSPFGFSDRAPDGDYSRAQQAERIIALAQAMEMTPVIVAHSFGAAPAAEAVMRAPEQFAGLVMVAGAIGLDSHLTPKKLPFPLRSAALRRWVGSATALNPYLTGTLLRQMLANKDAATPEIIEVLQRPSARSGTTEAFADWLPSLLAPPQDALSTRPENWRDLTLPVQLIWGDADTITPPGQAEALANLLNVPVLWLPEVGHIPHIEAPDAFLSTLNTALETVRAQ